MEKMYNDIYKDLCSTGLACEHPESLWRNKEGEIVEREEEAFGLKSKFELICPDWLFFVDECGCNTSQAKDGVVGDQTYLCSITGRPQK